MGIKKVKLPGRKQHVPQDAALFIGGLEKRFGREFVHLGELRNVGSSLKGVNISGYDENNRILKVKFSNSGYILEINVRLNQKDPSIYQAAIDFIHDYKTK